MVSVAVRELGALRDPATRTGPLGRRVRRFPFTLLARGQDFQRREFVRIRLAVRRKSSSYGQMAVSVRLETCLPPAALRDPRQRVQSLPEAQRQDLQLLGRL